MAALIDAGINLVAVFIVAIVLVVLGFGGLLLTVAGATATDSGGGDPSPFAGFFCCGMCCGPFLLILLVNLTALVVGLFNKIWLVNKRGASVGQGVMKLRVVGDRGQNVSIGTLVIRLLVQFGFGLIPPVQLLNLLWPLWDAKRQTLHDKAVGTFVIKIKPA